MRYAKLIGGLPLYAGNPIRFGENYIWNPVAAVHYVGLQACVGSTLSHEGTGNWLLLDSPLV